MKIAASALAALLLALAWEADGYGSGAPPAACGDMVPQHGPQPQKTPFPYVITVDKKSIKAGDTVRVSISGKGGAKFKGFFVQARVGDTPVGQFEKANGVGTISCGKGSENAATHTDPKDKQKIDIIWKSPERLSETVKFYVTVAKDGGTYWVRQTSDPVSVN